MAKTAFALSRFGTGARPGERETIGRDVYSWLSDGLTRPADISRFDGLEDSLKMAELARDFRMMRNAAKKDGKQLAGEEVRQADLRQATRQAVRAHLEQSVLGTTPIQERLALFWANHFTVSGANRRVLPLVSSFRREVVYPRLQARFVDLLKAATIHPAMLVYLDNISSVGPNSRAGRRRDADLNENLAREILELHTLGVGSGYSQSDVTSFAKVLTGWTVSRGSRFDERAGVRTGQAWFATNRHEPGKHSVLGKAYKENGALQLDAVLEDLASHPATARFVARKLAGHFISDAPNPDDIQAIADEFGRTDGHLPSLHKVTFERAMEHGQPFTRARSHRDWMTAALRALGTTSLDIRQTRRIAASLREMGQTPFSPPGPDGWPDSEAAWITPPGVTRRIAFSQALARQARGRDARALMQDLFGDMVSDTTATWIRRAESPAEGLALALASPEMFYA